MDDITYFKTNEIFQEKNEKIPFLKSIKLLKFYKYPRHYLKKSFNRRFAFGFSARLQLLSYGTKMNFVLFFVNRIYRQTASSLNNIIFWQLDANCVNIF